MKLGEIYGEELVANGKPLDGVRILAVEQMQALPFSTQLMSHLGAEVVKVEHPKTGDSGRGALPAVTDDDGRHVVSARAPVVSCACIYRLFLLMSRPAGRSIGLQQHDLCRRPIRGGPHPG